MTKYNKKNDYTSISWEFPEEITPKGIQDILKEHGKVCPICKKVFLSNNRSRKYCTEICAKRSLKKSRNGMIPNFTIFSRDGFRCHYCGRSPHTDPATILVIDHIIPISKGGSVAEENQITSCHQCNAQKHAVLLDSKIVEFLKG